jgi:hypothetical protein
LAADPLRNSSVNKALKTKLIVLSCVCIVGAAALLAAFPGQWNPLTWMFPEDEVVAAEAVVLKAENASGHDPAWERRWRGKIRTWGIRGSHKVEEGEIWFDKFPGKSGVYDVELGAFFEQDGSPFYRVTAGDRILGEGQFPYLTGARDCKGKGEAKHLRLGRHTIRQGERITIWGRSVYECPDMNGAYTLWHSIIFSPVSE